MSRTTGDPRADLAAWGVENLRLTTFHRTLPKAEGWWERLTGQEPDSSLGKKTGERVEIGPWEDMILALQIQPQDSRVDWIISELMGSQENPAPQLAERLPAFSGLADRWLTSDLYPETTVRMAFGAVVRLAVTDAEQGYRKLSDYLPFDIDRTTSSDFLYQINRQRNAVSIPDTRINRLMKWSVGLLSRQAVQFDPSGRLVATNEPDLVRCGCRLELDINTLFQAGMSLPRERLQPLFAEMVRLAEEIILEGDIP